MARHGGSFEKGIALIFLILVLVLVAYQCIVICGERYKRLGHDNISGAILKGSGTKGGRNFQRSGAKFGAKFQRVGGEIWGEIFKGRG